jgi:acyl-CoA thioesterase YciA
MNTYGDYEKCSSYLVKHPQLNATKILFGGTLLAWLDEASAIYASNHMMEDSIVTAKFGGIDFKVKTEVGMVVTVWAKVIKEGKSSLTLDVVATKRSMGSRSEIDIAKTEIVFVSIGPDDKPKIWRPERLTN